MSSDSHCGNMYGLSENQPFADLFAEPTSGAANDVFPHIRSNIFEVNAKAEIGSASSSSPSSARIFSGSITENTRCKGPGTALGYIPQDEV